MSRLLRLIFIINTFSLLAAGCGPRELEVLRLATTTSTYDSGLLTAILPDFEERYNARVDTVAVGTGQAIAIGENGDADVLLVHDRVKESAFVADGYGTSRTAVMFNDFVIVGPPNDPAGIRSLSTASEAFTRIAASQSEFISRGDQSGTHSREMSIWARTGITPGSGYDWYLSVGQGMGATLQIASEVGAYTLTDRGTYLAMANQLIGLTILFGGARLGENPDEALLNQYAVLPVNQDLYPEVAHDLAQDFVEWITSDEIQQQIAEFGLDKYQQPLFRPISEYP